MPTEQPEYVAAHDDCIRPVGPFLDDENNQCGSFYIFEADSEEDVPAWLDKEPFVSAGVYQELVIRRFALGKNEFPLKKLPAEKGS